MKNTIKKLWYKFMLYIERGKMHQLDIDMMSCNMSYEEYIERHEEIVKQYCDIKRKIEAIINNEQDGSACV